MLRLLSWLFKATWLMIDQSACKIKPHRERSFVRASNSLQKTCPLEWSASWLFRESNWNSSPSIKNATRGISAVGEDSIYHSKAFLEKSGENLRSFVPSKFTEWMVFVDRSWFVPMREACVWGVCSPSILRRSSQMSNPATTLTSAWIDGKKIVSSLTYTCRNRQLDWRELGFTVVLYPHCCFFFLLGLLYIAIFSLNLSCAIFNLWNWEKAFLMSLNMLVYFLFYFL